MPHATAPARALTVFFSAITLSAAAFGGVYNDVVVFGDSLSDTGTSLFYTNAIPIVTPRPTPPTYANGRWTNGATVQYNNLNLAPSAANSIWHWSMADAVGATRAQNQYTGVPNRNNYAAGAAVTGGGQQSILGFTTSDNIGYQVNTSFLGSAPTMSSTTLYSIMGGGNDIRDAVRSGAANDAPTARAVGVSAATNIAGYITSLATRAQAQNVRITVVWPNVVPMQAIPDFANAYGGNLAWRQVADLASTSFRDEWTAQITALSAAFPNNLDLKGVNFWQFFTDLATNPGGLNMADPILAFNNFGGIGFNPQRNAAIPNGANPDTYAFWDQVHPTASIQALMGAYAATQIPAPATSIPFILILTACNRRRTQRALCASKGRTVLRTEC